MKNNKLIYVKFTSISSIKKTTYPQLRSFPWALTMLSCAMAGHPTQPRADVQGEHCNCSGAGTQNTQHPWQDWPWPRFQEVPVATKCRSSYWVCVMSVAQLLLFEHPLWHQNGLHIAILRSRCCLNLICGKNHGDFVEMLQKVKLLLGADIVLQLDVVVS